MELVWPGVLLGNHFLQLLAELLNILRGGIGVGQHGHLLVYLGRYLQPELLLLLLRYTNIARVGEFRASGNYQQPRWLGNQQGEQERQPARRDVTVFHFSFVS